MNSLKTVVVVLLLLGISYGVFQIVNAPAPALDDDVALLDIAMGHEFDPTNHDESLQLPATDAGEQPPFPDFPTHGHLSLSSQNPAPPTSQSFQREDTGAPKFSESYPGTTADTRVAAADMMDSVPPLWNADARLGESARFADHIESPSDGASPHRHSNLDESIDSVTDNGVSLAGAAAGDEQESTDGAAAEPVSTLPAKLEDAWPLVNRQIAEGQFRVALSTLSHYYDSPLDEQQRFELCQWLDALAAKVIYSSEHLLFARPHVVREGESLESLGRAWRVPPALIYNVNRATIDDPLRLTPGTKLKMLRGPFRAEIDVNRREVTLFLNDLYAGRFPVQLPEGNGMPAGRYRVVAKGAASHTYTWINEDSSRSDLGSWVLQLGDRLRLGSKSAELDPQYSWITTSEQQLVDLWGILSHDSPVFVHR